jgi:hypothetical protein
VAVILVPVEKFADEPFPAADIFQLAGKLAVALVPIPLKFSVTGLELAIEICPHAVALNKRVQMVAAKKKPTLFINPPLIFLIVRPDN